MARLPEGEPAKQQIFERCLGAVVTSNDEFSEDPNRRVEFILHNAALAISTSASKSVSAEQDTSSISRNFSTVLQKGGEELGIPFLFRVFRAVAPQYRERTEDIVQEVTAILEEKGFRFRASLRTPREHQEIHSSGFRGIFWDEDPDVPVPVLRGRLIQAGHTELDEGSRKESIYSIEEADRARRLVGMTRLDPSTGRVTDQVDEEAANNSYIFLSPERRQAIMQREQEILAELDAFAKSTLQDKPNDADIIADLALYSEGKLTTLEIEDRFAELAEWKGTEHPLIVMGSVICEGLKRIAIETGKWDRILTPQEILLRTNGKVDERYLSRPYTPLGVQDGGNVEDIARLRRGEEFMTIENKLLGYERPLSFSLQDLDQDGNTTRSPSFVDDLNGDSIDEKMRATFAGKITTFPYARPDEWFYPNQLTP